MQRLISLLCVSAAASSPTTLLATFDGAADTTFAWEAVNDPVMGGQSTASFDVKNGEGVFVGEVKVVPFLHAPGFCTARTKVDAAKKFKDATGAEQISVTLKNAGSELTKFQLQLETSGGSAGSKKGTYTGIFVVDPKATGQQTLSVAVSDFVLTWRGEKIDGPALKDQLALIERIGVGSSGVAGKFDLELVSLSAGAAGAAVEASAYADLVTFDGAEGTSFKFRVVNDPVMGGLSTSTFVVDTDNKLATFNGTVVVVPKLKAPGFCNAETSGFLNKFADASSATHLMIKARTTTPDFAGFKISFAADTLNPQFNSFKANFNVTSADFAVVAIPFTSFSNDWSSFTGECDTTDPNGKTHVCCSTEHPEVCPTAEKLKKISQVGIWTEGVAGDFHIEIESIGAGIP